MLLNTFMSHTLIMEILDFFKINTLGIVYYSPFLLNPSFISASLGSQYFNLTDTIWSVQNSPVLITANITVLPGALLTILPGVLVQFTGGSSLIVAGSLNATGATFQGSSNVELITNCVGAACWGTILLNSSAANTQSVTNCTFSGGGAGYFGMVSVVDTTGTNGPVSFNAASFTNSCSSGLYISGGTVTISSSISSNNTLHGVNTVALDGSTNTVTNSVFVYNGASGFVVSGSAYSKLLVFSSTFSNNTLEGLNHTVSGVR